MKPWILPVLLILEIAFFTTIGGPTFHSVPEFFAYFRSYFGDLVAQSAPVLLLGFGMTIVIGTGGIDLSVGSLLGLCAVVFGKLWRDAGLSPALAGTLTVILGGSYGAGNYALCGKAFDPRFIFAWPHAKYAVMGAAQASDVVFNILTRSSKDRAPEELAALREQVKKDYVEQADIRYGAARGWVDAIIQPHDTRAVLLHALACATRPAPKTGFHTGVLQV